MDWRSFFITLYTKIYFSYTHYWKKSSVKEKRSLTFRKLSSFSLSRESREKLRNHPFRSVLVLFSNENANWKLKITEMRPVTFPVCWKGHVDFSFLNLKRKVNSSLRPKLKRQKNLTNLNLSFINKKIIVFIFKWRCLISNTTAKQPKKFAKNSHLCVGVENLAMKWNERLCMTSIGGRLLLLLLLCSSPPLEEIFFQSGICRAEGSQPNYALNKDVCVCERFRVQNSANTYNQNFIEDRLGFFCWEFRQPFLRLSNAKLPKIYLHKVSSF